MRPADGRADGRSPPGRTAQRSEELLVRSHDHQWAYDVDVEVVSGDEVILSERYYLLPGHTESGAVPAGDYRVEVTVDNDRTQTLECRLDRTPANTAVVEVGNGALSLTAGIHGSR